MQLDFVIGTRHSSQSAQCRGRETLRRVGVSKGVKEKRKEWKGNGEGEGDYFKRVNWFVHKFSNYVDSILKLVFMYMYISI